MDQLEAATRPLLRAFQEATGLDTTYLTRIAWDDDVQHILYSHHDHGIDIPEGLTVPWEDTLCRRALLSGDPCTSDVPGIWGDSDAARDLGIVTYVSAPVTLPDGRIWGTLCGASGDVRELDDHARRLLRLFTELLADRVDVEQDRLDTRERAEAAEALLHERAMIIAELEHKLKTPLTSAIGWVHMLDRYGEVHGESREWVEHANESLTQLKERVDRLLLEARSEVLRQQVEPVPDDLGAVVGAAIERIAGVAADHELATELAPVRACIDVAVVRDVVEHLVENAVKYAPAGTTIRVIVRDEDVPVLIVEDEGEGLPPDIDVFQPFVRGRQDRPGIGLGLHIVRSLVTACGATIEAGAAAGGGARFVVRWAPVGQER